MYLYYTKDNSYPNLRNDLQLHIRTEGKEHLCKGCNGDGKASSGCSTFQGLPKVNTRKGTIKYLTDWPALEWKIRKGNKTNVIIQKAQLIFQPISWFLPPGQIHLGVTWTNWGKVGASTPLVIPNSLPPSFSNCIEHKNVKMPKSFHIHVHLADVHPEVADWPPIEMHRLPHHCVPLTLQLIQIYRREKPDKLWPDWHKSEFHLHPAALHPVSEGWYKSRERVSHLVEKIIDCRKMGHCIRLYSKGQLTSRKL